MAALGACFEVCRTGALALLQLSVPDAMRGRIMSTLFLMTRLAGAIGVAVGRRRSRGLGPQSPLAVRRGAGVSGLGRRLLPARPDGGRIRFASRPGG